MSEELEGLTLRLGLIYSIWYSGFIMSGTSIYSFRQPVFSVTVLWSLAKGRKRIMESYNHNDIL